MPLTESDTSQIRKKIEVIIVEIADGRAYGLIKLNGPVNSKGRGLYDSEYEVCKAKKSDILPTWYCVDMGDSIGFVARIGNYWLCSPPRVKGRGYDFRGEMKTRKLALEKLVQVMDIKENVKNAKS